MAWTSPTLVTGANPAIFMQRFDGASAPVGVAVQVDSTHTGSQSHASIAPLLGGGFVMAWTVSGGADGSGDGVYEQRYAANGTAFGIVKVNTTTAGDQNDVSVAGVSNGGFIVTWTTAAAGGNGTTVLAQAFNALGAPVGSETSISAPANYNQTDAKVTTLPNGNIVVTWTSQDAAGTGISGQVFSDLVTVDANGASYRPEISVDGRYVTFGSDATNLVGGDTNNTGDTFVYDMVTQTVERVSVGSLGLQTFGNATLGDAVSGGGSIVSFGGVAIGGQSAMQLQPDGHTIKFTAQVSDLGGTNPLTLTLKVGGTARSPEAD